MKYRFARALAFALTVGTVAPASAAPFDDAAAAPIRAALAAVNAGDGLAFAREFTGDAAILDEISPFAFRGPTAARAWFERLRAVNRDNGITDERSAFDAPRDASIEGNDAYAVVPVRIAYRQRGRSIVENGAWTFALRNAGGTWKIVLAAFAPTSTSH